MHISRHLRRASGLALALLASAATPVLAVSTDLVGPEGSVFFGTDVRVLPNGNIVVADPGWVPPGSGADHVGAVHLYDGDTGTRISTLTGARTGDAVGAQVAVSTLGDVIVSSPNWDLDGNVLDVGAVTLIDGDTGLDGVVSTANSLHGTSASDHVGSQIRLLANGSFVSVAPLWNGAAGDVGAVTWVPSTGLTGPVTEQNSLVGSAAADRIGGGANGAVVVLPASKYVVVSPQWGTTDRGAVTWMDGADGALHAVGAVTTQNSLVGTTAGDAVGSGGTWVLSNGDFVVHSPAWDNTVAGTADAGAFTWGGNLAGLPGTIDGDPNSLTRNSLVGRATADTVGGSVVALPGGRAVVVTPNFNTTQAVDGGAVTWSGVPRTTGPINLAATIFGSHVDDHVGSGGVTVLSDGDYVVASPDWEVNNFGAVTWAAGSAATNAAVSDVNSLVGSRSGDRVGNNGITPLPAGAYVVLSLGWDNPDGVNNTDATNAGAVTWGGTSGVTGQVDPANSLVGTHTADSVGMSVFVLANGNYAVSAPNWDSDGVAQNVGAVAWSSRLGGATGPISPTNSLVGVHDGDRVATGTSTARGLRSGNYVVGSQTWDDEATADVGAVMIADGTNGSTGELTADRAVHGASAGDGDGMRTTPLVDGSVVLAVPAWDDPSGAADVGAVMWMDGGAELPPTTIAHVNSLYGTHLGDRVGSSTIIELEGRNYAVLSPDWDNGAATDAGAVTWALGAPAVGPVSAGNSLVGSTAGDHVGTSMWAISGADHVFALPAEGWDDGGVVDAGAVTYFDGERPLLGPITPYNSVIGSETDGIVTFSERATSDGSIIVTRSGQRITLFRPDTAAPTFPAAPADVVVRGTGPDGAVVTYTAPSAADDDSGVAAVVCDPPSGSQFPIGTTTVTCTATDNAGNASTTTFTVRVTDPNGPDPAGGDDYVGLVPARLADTRPGFATVDGTLAGGGVVGLGTVLEVPVAGRGGVPADAAGVVLNVTITEPQAAGYATVFPCGAEPPTASNLNFTPGVTVPNAVAAKVGAGGKVCVFVSQATHVIVDVGGYFPTGSTFHGVAPARLLDTRSGAVTVDGSGSGQGRRDDGSVTEVDVAGRGGVPANAASAVLNVTVTEPDGPGYVTVYPCGTQPPTASNANYPKDGTVANMVVSKIGEGGRVCVFSQSSAHLVVDVNGWFPSGSPYSAVVPQRLLDTRSGMATLDGQQSGGGATAAGSVTVVHVAGRGDVPADVKVAVLNVTVTEPTGAGYVTVYPCGVDAPLASNLNHAAGQTIPNAVVTKVGTNGDVCVYTQQSTHLVVDVNGFYR